MSLDYDKIKAPGFFKENRLPPHSDHQYFRSESEAQTGLSSFKFLLNGSWKFSYARNYTLAPQGFEKLEYNCKCWEDIIVPGHIQMQG
jgi:beta-galactosidase